MKWFDRWFMKMSRRAWETASKENTAYANAPNTKIEKYLHATRSLNMRLVPAVGGLVLEISYQNDVLDHFVNDLYVLDDNSDLAPQLASIIMQHKLKT
jgi:hypothetical protein